MSSREHRPYHERNLDQQVLDALLRIEELLTPQQIRRSKPELEDVFDPDGHKVGTVAKGKRK